MESLLKIYSNRSTYLSDFNGTQNENNVTNIQLEVPTEYEDFDKKIVFIFPNGKVKWDIIEDNKYVINKSISKYKKIKFYIWLTKEDKDFRSEEKELIFNVNENVDEELTKESISNFNVMVNLLDEKIVKVDEYKEDLKELIEDVKNKIDNGYFKGNNALINGYNIISLLAGNNIIITQEGNKIILEAKKFDDSLIQQDLRNLYNITDEIDKDLSNLYNNQASLNVELQEQEENINHLDDTKIDINVNNLLNYYLKQEVYTKQEVLNLIADIEKVHLKKVDQLPQIGEDNIIYLINGNEYIWTDNSYKLFGTTQIDLSDYYNKEEIDDKTKGFATTASLLAALNNYEPKLPNSTDLMFQSVTYGGGESGYRKYRNGMLEQWGVATTQASETEFTMHQAHIDTKFSVFIEPREVGNFFHYAIPSANQKFKCRIQSRDSVSMAIKFQWRSWGRWK